MSEIVYGIHVIEELLDNHPNKIICIFFSHTRQDLKFKKLISQAKKNNIAIKFVLKKWLTKTVKHNKHQGLIAYIKSSQVLKEKNLLEILKKEKSYLFLIFDNINDPRNLGACIRSAYLAGISGVIIKKNRSVKINSTVKKTSSGSTDLIPIIQVTNLIYTIKLLKKYHVKVIGTSHVSANNLYLENLNQSIALVMGAENKGISNLVQKNCDQIIKIPVVNKKFPLNISVATGICLFEIIRQKYYNKSSHN
ncbi:23S rRNA (Gm2251)-methyltransferase [Wigglesworthia glossinidia endosymbiont of Glossina morsitans morsitans (Yale colony)]|uniref:23S rRNA (Gm2251)-methyltransferase n=1 Tax=Wigglesworthia glossinidia endosymbiont of Glossina morsitans morsitans (Yale colony) TaxID=1142511 RepID=H6Q5D6_WIGGL|nr:23S rRNA (guanosine(2251)-2'-O)-methyltransferase RlmB [Wigglesworthia glossinidia]AFA41419.1 23S rRNA (Gm2251)-methyltransferase [Wigglesworthia glossinidia endosymbiont of Glossina morsitans morsitans (Yale colony)]